MNNDKNKQLLWKVLYDKHYFNTLENNQFDKVKQLFDDLILQVDTKNDTLLNKNKRFIKLFINELNMLKKPLKREDLIDNRKKELLNEFNKKTNELNEFKHVPPTEIDFSDIIQETPINLLNDTTKLAQKREEDIPIQPQILSILKEISNNQQEILNILNTLNKPLTSDIPINTDLINMDINE